MKRTLHHTLLGLLLLLLSSGYGHTDDTRASAGCDIATHAIGVDGGTLYYSTAGTGRRILLLHGLFADKEQWNGVLCLLSAAGYAPIAPDLPGYGKSVDFTVQDYNLEQQVALLHQFMTSLGLDRFDLAGNSMGGTIAALYSRQYPRQIRTLAFIGSPLGVIGWTTDVKHAIYQGINPFIPVDVAQLDLELGLLFVNPPSIPQAAKEAAVRNYVENNRHYQQVWDIVNLYDTALQSGLWIRTPTLIVWGTQDRIFPVAGAPRLRNRIPHSKLVNLPDAGHLPMLDNAGATAAAYIGFLRRYAD